jgi:hypothetical protein
MQTAQTIHERTPQQARFAELAVKYCELLNDEDIPAAPFRDPAVPYFSSLNGNHQTVLLKCLEAQLRVARNVVHGRGSLLDTWGIIWAFLTEMNFTAANDLIRFISPDDFVAIYNQHQMMLFLSPNHLNLVSYSLEDLYCRSWLQTFRRDPRVERVLIERAISFSHGRRTDTQSNEDIPPHLLTETDSPRMRMAMVRSRAYSPLFQNGVPVGFLSVNQTVVAPSRLPPREDPMQ